jgi:hypothetical protein
VLGLELLQVLNPSLFQITFFQSMGRISANLLYLRQRLVKAVLG